MAGPARRFDRAGTIVLIAGPPAPLLQAPPIQPPAIQQAPTPSLGFCMVTTRAIRQLPGDAGRGLASICRSLGQCQPGLAALQRQADGAGTDGGVVPGGLSRHAGLDQRRLGDDGGRLRVGQFYLTPGPSPNHRRGELAPAGLGCMCGRPGRSPAAFSLRSLR